MRYKQLDNWVLLGSVGIFIVTAPAAPEFAVAALVMGVLVKYGMDRFEREIAGRLKEKGRK